MLLNQGTQNDHFILFFAKQIFPEYVFDIQRTQNALFCGINVSTSHPDFNMFSLKISELILRSTIFLIFQEKVFAKKVVNSKKKFCKKF